MRVRRQHDGTEPCGPTQPGWCRRAPIWVGLGATAALVSDRPRKGEHRFHIAFANSAGIAHCVLWLARACGIAARSPRRLLDADEHHAETVVAAVDTIDQLLAGELGVLSSPA